MNQYDFIFPFKLAWHLVVGESQSSPEWIPLLKEKQLGFLNVISANSQMEASSVSY